MNYPAYRDDLNLQRVKVAQATWQSEAELYPILKAALDMPPESWDRIERHSTQLISALRAEQRPPLIDRFLTEYGLSSDEGVQLMRLAEALSRTTDSETANQLIHDKIAGGNWLSHVGGGRGMIMNMSGRVLHLVGKWLQWSDRHSGDSIRPISSLGDSVVRQATRTAIRTLSSQFVFAETLSGAMKRAKGYQRDGYLFSFDMLGEAARTHDDAAKYYRAYNDALDIVALHAKSDDPRHNHGISVKLSALHPRYEYGHAARVVPEIAELLKPLALRARAANVQLTIDAEEAERLDISMDVLASLVAMPELKGWHGLGFVVQAYQRRALPLLRWLQEQSRQLGARLFIRLVKGAYWDSEIKRAQEMGLKSYPVYTRKDMTDLSYLACARTLLDHPDCFTPQFATHNASTIAAIQEMASKGMRVEFQRLFGMGQQLHDMILKGPNVISRVYAPVGTQRDLLSYLIRRLLENGANSSFVHKLVDHDTPISNLTQSPIEALQQEGDIENSSISAPRDIFGGVRQSAQGWDLSHPLVQQEFQSGLEKHSNINWSAAPVVDGTIAPGDSCPIQNPANLEDIVGHWTSADEATADSAMEAASNAFRTAPNLSPKERAEKLRKAADLLEQRAPMFQSLAVREAGKTWNDAVAEVREAIDFCRYYAGQAVGKEFEQRSGLGVVVCISPWNFPLAIFLGQVTAALAAGNTVVAKPAEQTPLIAAEAVRLLHEAGFPPSFVNLTPGDGPNVGETLITHPTAAAICFTGSTKTAKHIARRLAELERSTIAFIAETGGINAMIVDSSALLEQTADDVISSAFQSAGQRCSALRVLCVQEDIADEMILILKGAMQALQIGNPSMIETDVGPVIDRAAMNNISVNQGRLDKDAKLIHRLDKPDDNGNFSSPSAYEINDLDDLDHEIFGPVLHVVRFAASDKADIIGKINALGYGLTLGIQSRIDGVSNRMANDAHVGNIYINRNQIGAVVGVQPFGGEGLSGTGPKAGGPLYLRRLSKSVTSLVPKHSEFAQTNAVGANGTSRYTDASDILIAASHAARKWNDYRSKTKTLKTICEDLGLSDDDQWRKSLQDMLCNQGELPSPAGETNSYAFRGRGVVMSILEDPNDILLMCIRALLTGNSFVHISKYSNNRHLTKIDQLISQLTGVHDLVQWIQIPDDDAILDLIGSASFGALIVSDTDAKIRDIGVKMAERDGPILPIISSGDGPERLVHEQTVTHNISAAGGNVALLNA